MKAKYIAIIILCVVIIGILITYLGIVTVRLVYAEEIVKTMYDMGRQARDQPQSTEEMREIIQGIKQIYPSGTVQKTGSHIDRILETVRSNIINDIEYSIKIKEIDKR